MRPFATGAKRLWSIPAGTGFIDTLADELAQAFDLAAHPEALSSSQIFVPNARSARALAEALFVRSGADGFLAPTIRALGDIAGEPPSVLLAGLGLDLPPALDPDRRAGLLTRLVAQYYASQGDEIAPSAASLAADDLAALLDQAILAGNPRLVGLGELVDGEIAEHFERSKAFLEILTAQWPLILEAENAVDALEYRRLAADELAKSWTERPPAGHVIIAGSTGTNPTSQTLMRAALRLEAGRVILPGLDADADGGVLDAPSHPQHALFETLRALGVAPGDVADWPVAASATALPRRRLLQAALAPADATPDWMGRLDRLAGSEERAEFVRKGLSGLNLAEAETEAEEAQVAALLIREALERVEGRIALVTPDATIARRVCSALGHWGVEVAPTAGQPLLRTPAGRLVALVARWLSDPGDPVTLLSVLKHEWVRGGEVAGLEPVSVLERAVMRGPRSWTGLAELARRVGDPKRDSQDVTPALKLVKRLDSLVQGHAWEGGASRPIRQAAMSVAAVCEALTVQTGSGPRIWTGADGAAASDFLSRFARMGDLLAPVTAWDFLSLLETRAAGVTLPDPASAHPRIAIWGPLEARLQSADLVILAGLNEGTWPSPPCGDMFLPRHLKRKLGLPDPETRVGLSAHDFSQLACAGEVWLIRSKRVDSQPSVPSRWWWRLGALSEGALGETSAREALYGAGERVWLKLARGFERPVPGLPAGEALIPLPRPPVEERPKGLSVTQVETLIRDPFAIYARHVLELEALAPVGEVFKPSARGSALHKALELFEIRVAEGGTADAGTLLDLLVAELDRSGLDPARVEAERSFLSRTAQQLMDWRAGRGTPQSRVHVELYGKTDIEIAGGVFELRGRADRVEQLPGGVIAIMDFKTGTVPSVKEVKSGLSPQMPLLAAIAAQGGFGPPFGAIRTDALSYIRFGAKLDERVIATGDDVDVLMAETVEGLKELIGEYAHPDKPYRSKPVAKFRKDWGDYDRLARRGEWADAGGAGE